MGKLFISVCVCVAFFFVTLLTAPMYLHTSAQAHVILKPMHFSTTIENKKRIYPALPPLEQLGYIW